MVAGQKSKGRFVPLGIKPGQNPSAGLSLCGNNGIEALTLYAFSSENWNRPAQEVSALMELFVWALDSEVKVCTDITCVCVLLAIPVALTRVCKNVFVNLKR